MIILVPALFFHLILFEELGPLFFICLAGFLADGKLGEHFDHRHETRQHDKVDKADLALGNVRGCSIVKRVNLEFVHLFEVTLREELNEKEVAPKTAQFPLFGRVRNVCKVEHKLNEELLILAIDFVEVEITVDIGDSLNLTKFDEMLGHVRGEDRLDDDVPAALEILAVHIDGPIARLIFRHERESSRQVVILKHADIVVPHGNLIIHIDQEDVIDTGVLEIMQSCANNATHLLETIELELVFHATFGHKVVESLANVGSMRLVMVSNALVTCGEIPYETHEFIEIDVVCSD